MWERGEVSTSARGAHTLPNPIVARLVAVSAAAVITAGGAGVALYQHAAAAPTAQTTTTTSTSTAATTSSHRVGAAPRQPLQSVLDGLVQQGKINSTQEQDILSAMQQYAKTHQRGPAAGKAAFGVLFRDEQQAIAKALGVTPQQLRTEMQGGKSINAIAATQKVDPATVQAAAVSAARTDLDKAVQAGKLNQAQETKILNALPAQLQKLFAATPGQSRGVGKPFQGPGGVKGRQPAATSTPGAAGVQ